MKSRIYIVILLLVIATVAAARPARPGTMTFTQPDGTTFEGKCHGDEFFKVKTTVEGFGIILQEDGWWCYARYLADGSRESTGHHVGASVPHDILEQSRNLPRVERKRYKVRQQSHIRTRSEGQTVKHGLIILAAFSDVDFKYKKEDFEKMLTQEGYSLNGATGSAKEYFDAQFNGTVEFDFEVTDIVRLDNMREYYGGNDRNGNDRRPAEMIRDACQKVDKETEIDFGKFDDDGDGLVDNIFVFFAGGDEAEQISKEEYIWSHAWYLSEAGITLKLDGVTIDSYACTAELTKTRSSEILSGIGTFCHEYSHTFGLPDLYDTDYDDAGGWAAGMWLSTSLMDGGNYNNEGNTPPYYNAIERELLGLSNPEIICRNGRYTLTPIGASGRCFRIDTETDGEYFLIECRDNEKWDKHIGGSGMLAYHIDKTDMAVWNLTNSVNATAYHQYADLIEADGRIDYFNSEDEYRTLTGSVMGVFFPYGGNSIIQGGNPSFRLWNGKSSGISVTHISQNDDGSIIFSISGFDGEEPPLTNKINITAFPDAALISFESDIPHTGDATVTWGPTGQETTTINVAPYETGQYSLIIDGLEPGNKSYTVSVHFEVGELKGKVKEASFLTKRSPSVDWPYLHIINDDSAPEDKVRAFLRVYNAAEAEEIRWYFNGEETAPGPDGYFTFTTDGTVRARVYWADGSNDILEKVIRITRNAE